MKMMTRYEIKKMIAKKSSKIALLILAATIVIVCYFACDVTYVNSQGETEEGPSAVAKLRKMQKEWEGILTEETIAKVIAENHKIVLSPEYQSNDITQQDIAYSKGQGFMEIRELINRSYADDFSSYDYYKTDSLKESDASKFYTNRLQLLKTWLDTEADNRYSDKEKNYITRQYEEPETPFYYDYAKGWSQLFEYAATIIMITMLVLGFITSGIFSNEFAWKADSIFFSSYHGRNRAIVAKLGAGTIVVTVVYFMAVFLYSIVTLGFLGTDGWDCPIQILRWKTIYNIKIWQEYILIVVAGYIGCLFFSCLCMLVSAKTKSAVISVILPFVFLFLPSFLGGISSQTVSEILGLLPDQLLQVDLVLAYFNVYDIGSRVFSELAVLMLLYPLLTVALFPATYIVYKKKQAG